MNNWKDMDEEERTCLGCLACTVGTGVLVFLFGMSVLLLEQLMEQWGMTG